MFGNLFSRTAGLEHPEPETADVQVELPADIKAALAADVQAFTDRAAEITGGPAWGFSGDVSHYSAPQADREAG